MPRNSNLNQNQMALAGLEEYSNYIDREKGSRMLQGIRHRNRLRTDLMNQGKPVPLELTEDYTWDVLGGETHPDYAPKQEGQQ